jgi:hypothetical protein
MQYALFRLTPLASVALGAQPLLAVATDRLPSKVIALAQSQAPAQGAQKDRPPRVRCSRRANPNPKMRAARSLCARVCAPAKGARKGWRLLAQVRVRFDVLPATSLQGIELRANAPRELRNKGLRHDFLPARL